MTLIDLGDLRDEPGPYPDPGRSRRRGRPWQAASLVVALVLGTAVASVPTPRRSSVGVPVPPGSTASRFGDLLVAVTPARFGTADVQQVLAVELPAGRATAPRTLRLRWRIDVPELTNLRPMGRVGEFLLLFGMGGAGAGPAETVVVDTATGRIHRRQPGSMTRTEGGGLLLLTTTDDETGTIEVVDPVSGAARWRAPMDPHRLDYRSGDHGIDRVLRKLPGGRAEIRDADTGTVLADEAILREGPAALGEETQFADDLLVVVRAEPPELTAYDVDTLDRRWTSTVPSVDYVQPCGVVLCAWGDTGGMWALDPASGRIRWSDHRWMTAMAAGDRLLVTVGTPGRSESRVRVLDATTGRVRADVGEWQGTESRGAHRSPRVYRSLGDRGVLVVEVDVEAGLTRTLDVLPGGPEECELGPWPLLCRQRDGSYRLWWPAA
ncbi:PQQ-binding-like beta-propeller repeat protein [Micromonospora sp. WMMD882]|uniref:outer membrane protein assembly factor BamB family protein n=1 Tax=Micromonospora sp. WMMD882 TaxID=3015151 RepID=UPI00248BD97D|nr:PQQ-binding-like beta-propeller repeat protein [Micromonospora sp. WMMD882]WBB81764.1 PQQ-binding-like beta-propeller repeat protein [Micromonospora sp. WMMD882]